MSSITGDERGQQPEPGHLPEALERAAAAKDPDKLDSDTVISGTDWFLSQESEPLGRDTFELNVSGDPHKKKWVSFTIEPVDREIMKDIRKRATDENTGVEDDVVANELLVIQGLVEPDFADQRIRQGYADPRDALRKMFRHKPLLIDRIAGRIMTLSGSSSEDLREQLPQAAKEVSAAGN